MKRQIKLMMSLAVVMMVSLVMVACGGDKKAELKSLSLENEGLAVIAGQSITLTPKTDPANYSKSGVKYFLVTVEGAGEEATETETEIKADTKVGDHVTFAISAAKALTVTAAGAAADGDITVRAKLEGKTATAEVEIVSTATNNERVAQGLADTFLSNYSGFLTKLNNETLTLSDANGLQTAYDALTPRAKELADETIFIEADETVTPPVAEVKVGAIIATLDAYITDKEAEARNNSLKFATYGPGTGDNGYDAVVGTPVVTAEKITVTVKDYRAEGVTDEVTSDALVIDFISFINNDDYDVNKLVLKGVNGAEDRVIPFYYLVGYEDPTKPQETAQWSLTKGGEIKEGASRADIALFIHDGKAEAYYGITDGRVLTLEFYNEDALVATFVVEIEIEAAE